MEAEKSLCFQRRHCGDTPSEAGGTRWVALELKMLSAAAYQVEAKPVSAIPQHRRLYWYFEFPVADYQAFLSAE
jgi:hypothetical protein